MLNNLLRVIDCSHSRLHLRINCFFVQQKKQKYS